MEVITMQSEVYQQLIGKINSIEKYIVESLESQQKLENLDQMWVDSYEVCKFLKISERTLQRLRTNRVIPYSIIGGKTYYTIADIKHMLGQRRVRSSEEAVDNLIRHHRLNAQAKRKK